MTTVSSPLPLTAQRSGTRRAALLLSAFTILRLGLIPPVIASFLVDPLVTTVCLGAFMVADLYDGVLARRLSADGPRRRALDSIVDRIAIDACLIGATVAGAMPLPLLAGFLLRDLYCGALCAWMMRTSGAAISADVLYRGLSFLIAIWALAAPYVTSDMRAAAAGVLLLVAVIIAIDLTRLVRLVVAAGKTIRDRTVPADALRRDHRARRRAIRVAKHDARPMSARLARTRTM